MGEIETDANRLMALIKQGDEAAFVALYRCTQGKVFRYALQISGCRNCAEEAVQEVYMTLIRRPGMYDEKRGSALSLLYGIARNVVRRLMQQRQFRFRPLDDEQDRVSLAADGGETPYSRISKREQIETLREAILQLPVRYREVLVLCELQEMSYADAASAMRCRVGTVRSRLHRARDLLARKIKQSAEGSFAYGAEGTARGLL
jgi:RNA polymerase sigma-70 factor (ECF subfamily)